MRRLLVALALAAGCGNEDAGHQRREPVPSAVHVAAADAAPAARATVGVPACDAYLEDFARCIHKMDKAAQPAARRFLEDTRRVWWQSAHSVDGSGSLAQACRMASDAARNATAGLGCGF